MLNLLKRILGILHLVRRKMLFRPNAPLEQRVRFDAFIRPHFGYGVYFAALQAKALGIHRISVYEFGVAKGYGLIELENISDLVEKQTGIGVDVYGFDTGSGMPIPVDYRDLPNVWNPGLFNMDVDGLRKKLRRAELVVGDVRDTLPEFLTRKQISPIGFVSIDVDYYSSTTGVLKLFDAEYNELLPRVFCYFDDIIGDDWEIHCDYVGELLAIKEFNDSHEARKIAKINGFSHKRRIKASWNDKMFVLHSFEHPLYSKYIRRKPMWEKSRVGVAPFEDVRGH